MNEPLLTPYDNRFVVLPVKYLDLYKITIKKIKLKKYKKYNNIKKI